MSSARTLTLSLSAVVVLVAAFLLASKASGAMVALFWLLGVVPTHLLAYCAGRRRAQARFHSDRDGPDGLTASAEVAAGSPVRERRVTAPLQDQFSLQSRVRVEEAQAMLRQTEERLRQAQKMEAIGHLSGGLAHDLKNLLTVIQANGELLADAADGGAVPAELRDLLDATRRGVVLINKLLAFSRRQPLRFEALDLEAEVAELVSTLRRLLPENIQIRLRVDRPLRPVFADSGSLYQVLMNLMTNARDAMPSGGTLTVTLAEVRLREEDQLAHTWVTPGAYACLSVADTGGGISPELRQRIFEPFFTTKPPGAGSGLGLAVVYGLVKQHSGFIHVYSESGLGTTVRVYLPLATDALPEARSQTTTPAPKLPGGQEVILLVEDEPALRRAARRMLERLGYRVLGARDGVEALEVFHQHKGEIDLVFCDIVMPRLDGPGLWEALRGEGVSVKFLFTSGYGDRDLEQFSDRVAGGLLIAKPWTAEDLARSVREVLDLPVPTAVQPSGRPGLRMELRPVLIAEDNPDQAILLEIAFSQAGASNPVVVVEDGETAVAYLAGHPPYDDRERHPLPALFITDLEMPRRSGIEVLEWLTEQPELSTIPVVVFTASTDLLDQERAYQLGAAAYVVKPLQLRDLVATVRHWVNFWLGGEAGAHGDERGSRADPAFDARRSYTEPNTPTFGGPADR